MRVELGQVLQHRADEVGGGGGLALGCGPDPLARMLVESGCPDLSWEAGRPGRRDMFGPRLHPLAWLTIHESDEDGPTLIVRGQFPEGTGSLDYPPEAHPAPVRVKDTFAPMPQPQIDALLTAIAGVNCLPVPVLQNERVTEIAVFHRGQWFGSIVRNPDGGLLVLGETGERLTEENSPSAAARAVVQGRTKSRAKRRASIHRGAQDGAEASAGILVAPLVSKSAAPTAAEENAQCLTR